MKKRFLLTVVLPLLVWSSLSAQTTETIAPGQLVSGEITADDDTRTWSFDALEYDVYSILVEGINDFDPILQIRDSGGEVIITNDDYRYPATRDALLEAITIPTDDTYDLIVSGYAGSVGEFTVSMLPGYSVMQPRVNLTSVDQWETTGDVTAEVIDNTLNLSIMGVGSSGRHLNINLSPFQDYFVEVVVEAITGEAGWEFGLVLQQDEARYYSIEVDDDGLWRVSAVESGERRLIRNWADHPAIIAGESDFKLGALVRPQGFDVFYNDRLIGQISDDELTEAGQVGMAIATTSALDSTVNAVIESLTITTPRETEDGYLFPTTLIMGDTTQVIHELERRHVIPMGGQQSLDVAASFVERSFEGIDLFTLGGSTTYTDLVMSTTINLDLTDSGVIGCALMLQYIDNTNYMLAFLDNFGGYGVSKRLGNTFNNAFYGEIPELTSTTDNVILTIVSGQTLHYFINGQHVGSAEITPIVGQVGSAILNYDGVNARCQFSDTWLWRW